MLEKGIKGTIERATTPDMSARKVGSGDLDVFATPVMIALAEETALKSVSPYLGEGQGTVGTKVDIAHIAATPIGMQVRCETELIEVDRRRLVFNVEVYDEVERVAQGTHERFIVDVDKFFNKAESKKNAVPGGTAEQAAAAAEPAVERGTVSENAAQKEASAPKGGKGGTW